MRISKYIMAVLLMTVMFLGRWAAPIQADEPETDSPDYLNNCDTPDQQQAEACRSSSSSAPVLAAPIISAALEPAKNAGNGAIKGMYITYYGLGSPTFRQRAQILLETTELNAIVMDVKGDRGWVPYPTTVQTALDIGANDRIMIEAWADWMAWFEAREIYTIARIVVFKDEPFAAANPAWAVRNAESGGLWRDREGLGWADPTREEAWDYNIALAVETAQKGFDEIQFDYIRFPTDGNIRQATFGVENTEENRRAAITGFLARADEALAPYDVKISADVFGYTAWRHDDLGIGQYIESLAPYLDVISPMLYPSTFAYGLPGTTAFNQAIAFPYEIVHKSTSNAVERLKVINPQIEVRPWIQDFPDYAFDRRIYTPSEIRLQMAGAMDAGGSGWLLWDPRIQYTTNALASTVPAYSPNLDGKILVLQYHHIGYPENRRQRRPEGFRADLERLRQEGYYPINLRDLVEGNLGQVPSGKRPIVLTFDDSSVDQFRILPDGSIDPESAVGILKAFHEEYPADWPLRATFFIQEEADGAASILFGQSELVQYKLQLLVNWGMELGSQTVSQIDLANSDSPDNLLQVGTSQFSLRQYLPAYEVVSLSMPSGYYPADDEWLQQGSYKAAVEASGGFNEPPQSPTFDPFRIHRVQATQFELDYWLNRANQSGLYYVSAGE